ncbi:MAG: hypothetical protein Ta2G_12890 [Termitinemataceae bacterium]|nr:MAG: hypothetical protein Ta2G_12890 [Termitinemataceae bacterium]
MGKSARFADIYKMKSYFFLFITFCFFLTPLFSQDNNFNGEEAAAASYAEFALDAIHGGRGAEAKEILLRAADYASVSSDLSYLLALVQSKQQDYQDDVLSALRLAIATDRWNIFSKNDALILLSRTLITVKMFYEAQRTLNELDNSEIAVELKLLALKGMDDAKGFRKLMKDALNRYPHNTQIVRTLFAYSTRINYPSNEDRALLDIALKRLDVLMRDDPDLAYLAAPFISDTDLSRRILTSWRVSKTAPIPQDSLPISLKLGILSEDVAITELFAETLASKNRFLDKNIIVQVYDLLRNEKSRSLFSNYISTFSGTIKEDTDGDGLKETETLYDYGQIVSFKSDNDQNGNAETIIEFSANDPIKALIGDIVIKWEHYPSVFEAQQGNYRYFFKPSDFYYKPIQFTDLCGIGSEDEGGTVGLLYPELNQISQRLNETILFSSAYLVERPSMEFSGGIEKIECQNGIVTSVTEYLNDKAVSTTKYKNGIPIYQVVDLDLDGRMESRRYFSPTAVEGVYEIDRIETDFDTKSPPDTSYSYDLGLGL